MAWEGVWYMALTQKDKEEIKELFKSAVSLGKKIERNTYKQTEKRLYAYPVLKKNIERYKKDIEDVNQEEFSRSKDIAFYAAGAGTEKPDIEEIRKAKIFVIEQKIARDREEIKEIEAALDEIRNDEYFEIIPLHYFQKVDQETITKRVYCDKVTVWRNRKRLLNIINICLFGADAL